MYRFKEEFRDAEIHIAAKRLKINRFNLNDEYAQLILKKFPQFAHNIEPVPEEIEVPKEVIQEEIEQEPQEKSLPEKSKPVKSTRRRSKQ
jgi:hypothetical protein